MPTLEESAKEYSEEEYRYINDKTGIIKDRKERLKRRLQELYIAEYRLKRANTTIKRQKESQKETQERLNEMLAYEEIRELFSKLQKEKKEKEKKEKEKKEEEDSDSDSDDEDEFVSVQGIKYLVVEEDVADLKSGKIVGQMQDGKLVFSKPGTKLHKKRVDELKK